MSILAQSQIVREKLTASPITRDDDNILIASVLESLEEKLEKMSAAEFLGNLRQGKYGSLESIRRSRQFIQQHNPSLRGALWEKRHHMAKGVASQLKFNF